MTAVTHPVMQVLRDHPVLDGHNDLPWCYRRHDYDLAALDLLTDLTGTTHTDLLRARAGGLGGQFWSAYVDCSLGEHEAVTATLEQIDCIHRLAARYPEHLQLATTADEVEAAMAAGRIASLIGVEGAHQLGGSLAALRMYHRLGARYLTLSHNDNNPFCDAATDEPEHGGLSDRGRELVREINRLGMFVDLSHVSAEVMHQALDVSQAPVIFSHSSARAVTSTPRNVPDDVLERIPANGGVVMAVFAPAFVSQELFDWAQAAKGAAEADGVDVGDWHALKAFSATYEQEHPKPAARLADVADHLDHLKAVVGPEHVGLGGDYDGVPFGPEGLEDVSCYPALFVELHGRGWSEDELAGLACRNVLRAMRDMEAAAQR